MKITELQANVILNAFSYVHSEGQMDSEDKDVCKEILKAFPMFDKHIKLVETVDLGYSYLVKL